MRGNLSLVSHFGRTNPFWRSRGVSAPQHGGGFQNSDDGDEGRQAIFFVCERCSLERIKQW